MNRFAFNKSSTGFQQIPKRNHKIKIKTRKNPVSMPIYKISPKAAKSPDHNSDSNGQRFESPRPHHTKTPCTFKKVQGVFSFETIPDRTGFILRPDQGWSYQHKQHQRIPKSKRHPAKHAPERFVLGDHADPDRLMPAPRETDSQRRRPCRWQRCTGVRRRWSCKPGC